MRPIRSFLEDRSWPCALIAHRGAWHYGPENSIAAINTAVDHGHAFIELDIAESLDGTFYCIHDETLDRMTSASGWSGLRSWADLSKARLKQNNGFDKPLTNETIPSLDAALEATRDRIYVDLDVKHQRQVPRVAEIIKQKQMTENVNLKLDVLCRSDAEDIKRLEARTGCLVKPIFRIDEHNIENTLSVLEDYSFPMIEVLCGSYDVLTEVTERARLIGTDVFVNTLDAVPSSPIKDSDALKDPAATWGKLVSSGVRLIQTDEPTALQTYIQSLSKTPHATHIA